MPGKIAILVLFFVLLFSFTPAHADVAPPQPPQGSSLAPEGETQVRMVAETVTMTVIKFPPGDAQGHIKVQAVFTMRNLGTEEERMYARFPLTGGADSFGGTSEITDFKIKVDGNSVGALRVTDDSGTPWASFPVIFPPDKDVILDVTYSSYGAAYDADPTVGFTYILETGVGWKDTIGSADIIVKLPYDASAGNVVSYWMDVQPTYSGNEARWHLENFEPDWSYNFQIQVVKPARWLSILQEADNVTSKPSDGEAWGRLGKAYKSTILFPKGYLRDDPGGPELYDLAVQAYQKSVDIKPDDALWHAGFAELLWYHYVSYNYIYDDNATLTRALQELQTSLQLDPSNTPAVTLADTISSWMPEILNKNGSSYEYLALTATPTLRPMDTLAPTDTAEATSSLSESLSKPTATQVPAATGLPPTSAPDTTPQPSPAPVCGGAALIPAMLGVFWLKKRAKMF